MANIVYALTNPAMPGLVKIGMTDGSGVQARMTNLYSTGVPFPFECAIAWEIEGKDALVVEAALHTAFGPNRVNPSREFFEIDPEQVQAVLRIMPGREVTPRGPEEEGEEDRAAAAEYQKRKTRTNELEFLESLSDSGVRIYERVLALGRTADMLVRWGTKGFSLNVLSNNKIISVCYGFPPSAYNQALYTSFSIIRNKCDVPSEALNDLRESGLATRLLVPAGRGEELRCPTDQNLDESQLIAITGWLTELIALVREHETDGQDENQQNDLPV